MQLTPSDLALVRTQPQQNQLFLSFYQPETVFAGQVSTNISKGERTISCGNVTGGSPSGVLPNFMMMVGTTPGGNDVGTVRVRNVFATGTIFVVAENSHIPWVSGQYVTILNYVDVEAIYPRMVQVPNQVDVTFYKDYDIAYTNQNSILGSFVCMGPHRAAFRDRATGQAQLFWSASGTYNVNGDSLSFQWEFEGGTPSGSSSQYPGYVTYNTPGHYRTRLTVTSSEGAVDFGYRFVSIYDRPDAGPNRPLVNWEIEDLSGSRKTAGYTGRIRIWEPVGPNFVKDGQLVVIFSDDFYGTTRKNLGGNAENCSDIFWVGYVLKGSIIYDYKSSTVEFSVGSVTEMMKQAQGFGVSCQADAAPNTWFKILNMTVQKAVYHYLRWHSTAFNVMDFQYTGDDRQVQYFDSSRESMYDAIANFIEVGLKGEVVADRQGKVWAEITPAATNNANTAFPLCMPIGPNDWGSNPQTNSVAVSSRAAKVSNGPVITERVFPEISYVEYGGIAYYGPTLGTWAPFIAGAPGTAPAYKGSIDHMEGMILNSQTQLNQIVGASYAYQNSRYPEIAFPMVGAYKNIDIAPIETIQMNIAAGDTARGIVLNNEPFHTIAQEWRYFSREKSLIHTLHLAQLVDSLSDGDTITIPVTPPVTGFQVPKFSLPPLNVPAFNFGPTATSPDAQANAVLLLRDAGFVYSRNLNSGVTWALMNNGLPDTVGLSNLQITSTGRLFCKYQSQSGTVTDAIYYADSVGQPWQKLWDINYFKNLYGGNFNPDFFPGGTTNARIIAIGANPTADDEILVLVGGTYQVAGNALAYGYYGTHAGISLTKAGFPAWQRFYTYWDTPQTFNRGDIRAALKMNSNYEWILNSMEGGGKLAIIDRTAGAAVSNLDTHFSGPTALGLPAATINNINLAAMVPMASTAAFTSDGGHTWSLLVGNMPLPYYDHDTTPSNPAHYYAPVACNADGSRALMGTFQSGTFASSDFGVTWSLVGSVSGSTTAVLWMGANVGGVDSFMIARRYSVANSILPTFVIGITSDYGNTYTDVTGNLRSIVSEIRVREMVTY